MEELHRIHKEVPFGYWVLWVQPTAKFLTRRWKERKFPRLPEGLDRLSAPH
jgi:hypothetical protein